MGLPPCLLGDYSTDHTIEIFKQMVYLCLIKTCQKEHSLLKYLFPKAFPKEGIGIVI